MGEFQNSLYERVKARPRTRILFPESQDSRIVDAALALNKEGLASPVMVHSAGADVARITEGGLVHIEVEDETANELEALLFELRGAKGLSAEQAKLLSRDPLIYAMYLLRTGKADALVAGATSPTADVVRAGLWLIGTAPGTRTVSSSFYMTVPNFRENETGHSEEVLTFADCGVVPNPTSEQLADIAIAAADTRSFVVGDVPHVAFLSYSTKGSGNKIDPSVSLVRGAMEIVKEKRPDINMDGELQGDTALIQAVAERKAPGSSVAGKANVLVFPNLDAANIAYKLVERLVPGARALGPILHGFASPISDLSRSAESPEIVDIAAVTALQVKDKK